MKPLPIQHPKNRAGASGKSPTERTMGFLRDLNYPCGIVERRIPKRHNLTLDLFQIIDIIALTPLGVLGVQSTGSDFAGHLTKLTVEKVLDSAKWIRTPNASLMLIGWRRVKRERGGKAVIWAPRIKMITADDLVPALTARQRTDLLRPAALPQGHFLEKYREYLED